MYTYNLPDRYLKVNGAILKWIACITMLIDHSAVFILYHGILMPNAPIARGTTLYSVYIFYRILRGIGRIAFPIYCFLIVEGYIHTKNVRKYAVRLLLFGIVSEIPFNLLVSMKVWDLNHQNVYFTLLAGLIAMWAFDRLAERKMELLQIVVAAAVCVLAEKLHTDYGWQGPALILLFYLMRKWRVPQCVLGSAILYNEFPWVLMGYLPLLFYNGERGRQMKYFFYVFYPAHLILLYLLTVCLHNCV